MAEKKKKQTAEFAKDKNAFAGGSPTKGKSTVQKMKQKQSGAHQPRDADTTSGHNVQKSGRSKTFGHDASHSVKQNHMESVNKPDKEIFQDNHSSFQNNTRKTTGQKAKQNQKKGRQRGDSKRKTAGRRTVSKKNNTAVFKMIQGKQQGRKQSRNRKNAGSKGSSKRKTALREIKKRRTVMMREAKCRTVFQRSRMLLWRRAEGNRPKKRKSLRTITAAGTLTTKAKKRADTAGGNIRTGNARKKVIPGVTSRQRIIPLRKAIASPMAQNRYVRAARN